MHTPACSHGGSHFALGSKTKPSATPRGASEPAETKATREARHRTAEPRPAKPMVGGSLSGTVDGEDGHGQAVRWMEMMEEFALEEPGAPHVAPAAAHAGGSVLVRGLVHCSVDGR